jgi:hypothetical protein
MHTHAFTRPAWTTLGPRPRLRCNLWLLLLVVVGLLGLSVAPSQASGGNWSVTSVDEVGCSGFDWQLTLRDEGWTVGATYTWRSQVIVEGKTYMDQGITGTWTSDSSYAWELGPTLNYGPVANPGAWPIAPGTPMKLVLTIEQPKGTVLSSWTMVAASCDSSALLYNGPTAADLDEDHLAAPADLCPILRAFTSNGCPTADRTLVLKGKRDPRRLVGKILAGHPALSAGQPVTIWKARPGPDRKVAARTTNSAGAFKLRAREGRYYATAPGVLVPTAGQAAPERSTTTRVR